MKGDPDTKRQIVEVNLDKKAAPDALMYYPPVYQIHIAFVILCCIAGSLLAAQQPNALNVTATVLLVPLAIIFAWHCWKWRPSEMPILIERNVVIWQHALGTKSQANGLPKPAAGSTVTSGGGA